MSISLLVHVPAGTLPNGRERLVGTEYPVSPSEGGFTARLAALLGCGDAVSDVRSGKIQSVEIDPSQLIALPVDSRLNIVDGEGYRDMDFYIGNLADAQKAARAEGARVMVQATF